MWFLRWVEMPVLLISLELWCCSRLSCGGIFLVLLHCLPHPHPLFSREFSGGPDGGADGRRNSSLHAAASGPASLAALSPGLCLLVSSKQSCFSFNFQS